jgi:hypothetical protein
MQIFVLSKNTKECAKYYADKHVVKIILEIAQLLCSAHRILDSVEDIEGTELYKTTHKNHPCAIWVRESKANYEWTYDLFYDLCEEYTFRYGKVHLCAEKFRDILVFVPENIPDIPMTSFALAMPDECKTKDAIESYRNYYKTNKRHLCVWTKREVPDWFE